jgi:hypothetical protein
VRLSFGEGLRVPILALLALRGAQLGGPRVPATLLAVVARVGTTLLLLRALLAQKSCFEHCLRWSRWTTTSEEWRIKVVA